MLVTMIKKEIKVYTRTKNNKEYTTYRININKTDNIEPGTVYILNEQEYNQVKELEQENKQLQEQLNSQDKEKIQEQVSNEIEINDLKELQENYINHIQELEQELKELHQDKEQDIKEFKEQEQDLINKFYRILKVYDTGIAALKDSSMFTRLFRKNNLIQELEQGYNDIENLITGNDHQEKTINYVPATNNE